MDNSGFNPSISQSTNYFQFEADFVGSLHCIPMQVRMKLDNCGVKLKLVHWNQFTSSERQALVNMPCETELETKTYKEFLQNLVTEKTGQPAKELTIDPHPPWLDATTIPNEVIVKAQESHISLSLEQWRNLTPAQRFALIKLSRPSHENKNFLPALQEFGIIS
ncbi:nitrate reductase associated protein [Pleurocapsa sp. PCC 7319]|uniref:nitrate reductase associated protein n=1 Tax=Pleurocapsa sp. PCC 7319 TaxID=118161 RepID=UPI000346962D|nr:nitrate reductase associated protein [Pleurocapsa sp. PCC 7319]